jgi:hypothetical protein
MFEAMKSVSSAGCEVTYDLNKHQDLINKDKEACDVFHNLFPCSVDLDEEGSLTYPQQKKLSDVYSYLLPGVSRYARNIIEEAVEDSFNKAQRIKEARQASNSSQKAYKEFNDEIHKLNETILELDKRIAAMCEFEANQFNVISDLGQRIDNQIYMIDGKDAEIKVLQKQLFGDIIDQEDIKI